MWSYSVEVVGDGLVAKVNGKKYGVISENGLQILLNVSNPVGYLLEVIEIAERTLATLEFGNDGLVSLLLNEDLNQRLRVQFSKRHQKYEFPSLPVVRVCIEDCP